MVAALDPVDHARLGHPDDIFVPIEEIEPDVVALGYDQHHDDEASPLPSPTEASTPRCAGRRAVRWTTTTCSTGASSTGFSRIGARTATGQSVTAVERRRNVRSKIASPTISTFSVSNRFRRARQLPIRATTTTVLANTIASLSTTSKRRHSWNHTKVKGPSPECVPSSPRVRTVEERPRCGAGQSRSAMTREGRKLQSTAVRNLHALGLRKVRREDARGALANRRRVRP